MLRNYVRPKTGKGGILKGEKKSLKVDYVNEAKKLDNLAFSMFYSYLFSFLFDRESKPEW